MTRTSDSIEPSVHEENQVLRSRWDELTIEEKGEQFRQMEASAAEDLFESLKSQEQAELLAQLPYKAWRPLVRLLAPDDLADVMQELHFEHRQTVLAVLDMRTRSELAALLAYAEDQAGGLMNPRFARVRPEMPIAEAMQYIRKQAHQDLEHLETIYVLDSEQKLIGIVNLSDLFKAPDYHPIRDLMKTRVVRANENMDQEALKQLFAQNNLTAIPIEDGQGRMIGVVTAEDLVQVAEEEATEDMQQMGGVEVLDAPYLKMDILSMVKKRAGWLTVLFIGEMFTATAMGYFEKQIEQAVVLALFIPLIISSGGNSGSQASTLVVRAMALQEVRLRDWWKVLGRELLIGTLLGCILGSIGLIRILLWPTRETLYGIHYMLVGYTVSISLVGVVLWGSISGSMLPFMLKKLRLDPATASAPFVATLVDVSGLIIYFTIASLLLRGTLL